MNKTLKECTMEVIENLQKGELYFPKINMVYNQRAKRISFSTEGNGILYNSKTLESLFTENEIKTCAFYELGKSTKKATHVAKFRNMLFNRVIVEVAKKTPSPKLKNYLYKLINFNIPNPSEVIISPNTLLDYLYPQLLTINAGTFVGEEAFLLTHYFTTNKFVIGDVEIGKNCLIGARSIILPGVKIGDNVQIGANTVISQDIESGRKIKPCGFVGRTQ